MGPAAPHIDFASRLCVVNPVFTLIHDTLEDLDVIFEEEAMDGLVVKIKDVCQKLEV